MEEEIKKLKSSLTRKKRLNPVEGVTHLNKDRYIQASADIHSQLEVADERFSRYLTMYGSMLGDDVMAQERASHETWLDELVQYLTRVELKIAEVVEATAMRNITTAAESINIGQQDRLEETILNISNNESVKVARSAKYEAVSKANHVSADCVKMDADLLKIELEDWSSVSDLEVEQGFQDIKTWSQKLDVIKKDQREIEYLLAKNGVGPDEVQDVLDSAAALKKTEFNFLSVKEAIHWQDETRELYIDQASSSKDKMEYPQFGGLPSECFQDFQEKMDKALLNNKVKKDIKVDRLRTVLSGKAKSLVPETMKDYDKAMDALEKAFGDPTILLRFRQQELKKIGKLPKGKPSSVVEWFLSLEVIIQSMLDMAKRAQENGNTDIVNTLLSIDLIRTIAALFPQTDGKLILKCAQSYGMERLTGVKKAVAKMRTENQEWSLVLDATNPPGGGGGQPVKMNHVYLSLSQLVPDLPDVLQHFDPPDKFDSCRVCQELEANGDHCQLFVDHHSNYVTGCPRFLAMNTEERHNIALRAELCLYCLDPTFYCDEEDSHDCVEDFKETFSCPGEGCFLHVLVCMEHRPDNVPALEKLQEEAQQSQLQFSYFVNSNIWSQLSAGVNAVKYSDVDSNNNFASMDNATTGSQFFDTGGGQPALDNAGDEEEDLETQVSPPGVPCSLSD